MRFEILLKLPKRDITRQASGETDGTNMTKFKIRWIEDNEEEDDIFESFEDADDMATYYQSCAEEGAETLSMSNSENYYSEDDFERPEYEIVEVDD